MSWHTLVQLCHFSVLLKENSLLVHFDGTSRIQTIFERADNPYLHDLLTMLDEKYNIKALINTSFNIKGEPIVHTKKDALNSARDMNIDGVVINGKLHHLK